MKKPIKEKTYFIGLCLNSRKNRAILQARRNKDNLSCELYQYYGERITTKEQLKAGKFTLLQEFKKIYPKLISLRID